MIDVCHILFESIENISEFKLMANCVNSIGDIKPPNTFTWKNKNLLTNDNVDEILVPLVDQNNNEKTIKRWEKNTN